MIAKAGPSPAFLILGRAPQPTPAPEDDPELDLLVFGKRLKRKRSELVEAFDLGHLPDERIIKLAQKEMAADQRLAEAKEVANQRPSSPSPTSAAQGDDRPANQRRGSEPGRRRTEARPIPSPGPTRPGRRSPQYAARITSATQRTQDSS